MGDGIRRNGNGRRTASGRSDGPWHRRGDERVHARSGRKPYHTPPSHQCDRARRCCGCARCGDPRREAWVHETCQALSAARTPVQSPSFKRKKILHAGGFHVLKADRQASSADHSENTGYVAMCHVPHRMQGPHQGFPAAAATSAHNGCPGLRRKPDHRSPAVVSYWAGVSRAPPASCQTD